VSTQELVLEETKFNLLLMLNLAVDAKLATGQDSSQIPLELNAFQDHLLSVLSALLDNLMMDTHARNAQLDLLLIQITLRDATSQLVPVLASIDFKDNQQTYQSNSHMIISPVEDVRFANGHNTFQMPAELNASLDQEPPAQFAHRDNLTMDTHALHAQLVKSTLIMSMLLTTLIT
jgi:hypothetical protein